MNAGTTTNYMSLEAMPAEILEYIAVFLGTSEMMGPPSDLAVLCRTSRYIHATLAFKLAPSVYAAIFRAKFDHVAPLRRVGSARLTAQCLATELFTRFAILRRFRTKERISASNLWTAIFMMLENSGKNAAQLHEYAALDVWLRDFLLDSDGESGVINDLDNGIWPRDTQMVSLAMWLLWLSYANGIHDESAAVSRSYLDILRTYAFGAQKYPVTHQSWIAFSRIPSSPPWDCVEHSHYGTTLKPTPPATSISAILCYMARFRTLRRSTQPFEFLREAGTPAGDPSLYWDCDWARCIDAPGAHHQGSLDGAWEGPFTYIEFSVYAAMLSGGPPQMLHDGAIGQNLQIWRLREYHMPLDDVTSGGLPAGEVLDAFFPLNATWRKTNDRVVFHHGSREYIYTRVNRATAETRTPSDVVVFGEGHSSWGTFLLRGRMRSSDAFVTVMKEYSDTDDRGRWLYRGYLIGGKLVVLSLTGEFDGTGDGFCVSTGIFAYWLRDMVKP